MLFLLCSAVLSIPGGFMPIEKIEESDPHILKFIQTQVPKLFPEIKPNTEIEIKSAEKQVVAGFNYHLTVKAGPFLSFKINIFNDLKGKLFVTSIQRPMGQKRMVGAYKWINPSRVEADQLNTIKEELLKSNGFTGSIKEIICARQQIVSGINTHLIFTDVDGTVYSTVAYRNIKRETKITFYNKIEQ